jgi:ATP-dependent RNA helicase DeaD
MPPRIQSIAHRHLRHPVEITIAKEPVKAGTAPKVQQTAYIVTRPHRSAALARIIDMAGPVSALVFCRTRLEVDEVTLMLNGRGHRAEAIHGGMSQLQRDRVMHAFRTGQTQLLVATDVAARGLDIPHVSHVINYDLPSSAEVYVHRIGRTGRAGREGAAITILDPREQRLLRSIEQLTKAKVVVTSVPSVGDLLAKRLERTRTAVQQTVAAGDLDQFRGVISAMAESVDVAMIAAAAFKLVFRAEGGERAEEDIPTVPVRSADWSQASGRDSGARRHAGDGARSMGHKRDRSSHEAGMARLYVGAGRDAGIRPGDLVGAIANEAKINSNLIGAIQIEERFSLVDVPERLAQGIVQVLGRARIKGRKVGVRLFRE